MHDNMIVNMSSHAGKGTGTDMEIEHLIRLNKVCTVIKMTHHTKHGFQHLFLFRGIHANWDCLGNLSAICALLSFFKKRCNMELDSQYSGSSHTRPDTSSYIWMVLWSVTTGDTEGGVCLHKALQVLANTHLR